MIHKLTDNISDRGPQFSSAVWSAVCGLLNIKHMMTTAYHPQSNGMLERFHRRLKTVLRARSSSAAWSSQLPLILLHLRATPRDNFPRSPAEAVDGAQLVLPGQLLGTPEPPDLLHPVGGSHGKFSTYTCHPCCSSSGTSGRAPSQLTGRLTYLCLQRWLPWSSSNNLGRPIQCSSMVPPRFPPPGGHQRGDSQHP